MITETVHGADCKCRVGTPSEACPSAVVQPVRSCGVHTVVVNQYATPEGPHGQYGFRLESPDVMRIETVGTGQVLLHWLESSGWVQFQKDGTEKEYGHAKLVNIDGWEFRLPTEKQSERLIELLRSLDGVEY